MYSKLHWGRERSRCLRQRTAPLWRYHPGRLPHRSGLLCTLTLLVLMDAFAGVSGSAGGKRPVRHGTPVARSSAKSPLQEDKAARTGDKYAVIVGVNDYAGRVPSLRYAVSDAHRIYDTLVDPRIGGLPKDHVLLLTSDATDATPKPDHDNILHAVETMTRKTRKGDQLWFYFAGHGIEYHQRSYLLPQGFMCSDLDKTALSTHFLRELLDKECKASQKVIILDACQSGSARGLDAAPPLQQTLNGAGMITLSACSVNESAWEFPHFADGNGGGVFTYYLVNGLKKYADANRDGIISVPEIKDYVLARVSQEIQNTQHVSQTPQFIATRTSDLNHVYLTRTADDAAAQEPLAPDMAGLEVKKPLPPALLVLLNGQAGQSGPGNPIENEVIKRLLAKGFLIADPQAADILHSLSGDKQAAQEAGKRGARFLAVGQYTVSVNSPVPPFVTVVVSISARLVDEQGTTLATAKGVSGPHAAGGEAAAEAEAIEDAAEKFVDDLATSGVKKALGLDKPRP
jgi:uncharacterized caspase-like protein